MTRMNDLWQQLEAELDAMHSGQARPGIHSVVATPEVGQRLRVGIEWPSRARVLIFTADTHALPQRATWPECRGLELELDMQRSGTSTLVVRLRESRSQDVFSVLAADLAQRAIGGSEQQAAQRVLAALARWQRFLAAAARSLSDDARRGLWGELYALERVVLSELGAEAAVNAWRGPSGSPQDFQCRGCAVEVKTRAARSPAVVRISGELQLHDDPWQNLFLLHLAVDEVDGAGETLLQRVTNLRHRLAGTSAAELLEDSLADAGWLDAEAEKHAVRGFTLRTLEAFRVADGFPRLTPTVLPAGVGGVAYDLGLDAAAPFACSLAEVSTALHKSLPIHGLH